ncbi:acetyltransferase [Legionella donaldsonii]|uniref:Acetyltransferase n=3 Tax=Legionella donaldsonii TaxID=45060 RepID=A0A378JAE8_9GAMM|nr:acetyltransferase [Legionella donaldsonii]
MSGNGLSNRLGSSTSAEEVIMHRLFTIFILISSSLSFNALAQQSGGSGGGEDLKGVCELSGGNWTGSETGNWACCWPDWGCYGCVDGNCKIKCHTQRCKDANGVGRPSTNEILLQGIAPAGMKAPIVPKRPKATIKNPSNSTLQKTQ